MVWTDVDTKYETKTIIVFIIAGTIIIITIHFNHHNHPKIIGCLTELWFGLTSIQVRYKDDHCFHHYRHHHYHHIHHHNHPRIAKSARFQVPRIGTSSAETKNGDRFLMPTSPQNGGLHVCSMRLAHLGVF